MTISFQVSRAHRILIVRRLNYFRDEFGFVRLDHLHLDPALGLQVPQVNSGRGDSVPDRFHRLKAIDDLRSDEVHTVATCLFIPTRLAPLPDGVILGDNNQTVVVMMKSPPTL